jgi:glutathione S-transferase
MSTEPFRLYGAERSYFTGKVRPALRAKRLYFEEVLPSPAIYQEIIRRTGMAFIPVVITPEDETWQDTSDIIDALDARIPEPALHPASPVQRVISSLLELYGDEFMILPAMHYRWTLPESRNDAARSFSAMSGDPESAGKFAERMGGSLMALGVNEATIPGIEAHLSRLLQAMESIFADQAFLLGDQISIGDCGMMGPFYAHLYLDLTPGQLLLEHAPRVCHWIERMNHPHPSSFTGFLKNDALHPGMRTLLELIGKDAVPLLLDSVRHFEAWADTRPADSEEPPRAVGFHETQICGVRSSRYTSSYTLWMLQRPLDAYAALSSDEKGAVDAALKGTGCEALFGYTPRHRLGKRDFKLVFESSSP